MFPYWEQRLFQVVSNEAYEASIEHMELIGRQRLYDFGRLHMDARDALNAWQAEVLEAEWRCPKDVKDRYPHASFLADNRVIFNVKGNRYRIDTKIAYQNQTVLVIRIGTHAEYDRWQFRRELQ